MTLAVYRTQLFDPCRHRQREKGPGRLQGGAALEVPRHRRARAAPAIDYIKPLSHDEEKTSLELFNILNFVLQYCPTVPSEKELMERFAKIGIGAGMEFDPAKLSPEMKKAFEEGIGRRVEGIRRWREAVWGRQADIRRCLRHPRPT